MSKHISVPTSWAVYIVPDETFTLLAGNIASTPPQVVLEMMVINGLAKRVARIGDFEVHSQDDDGTVYSTDFDENGDPKPAEPASGEGPWYNGAGDEDDEDEEEGEVADAT